MKEVLGKVKNRVVNGMLDVLFPATCVGCGKEGRYMCPRCEGFVSETALICPVCQQSSFDGERHYTCKTRYGLEGLASAWEYEGLMKSLLHYVKYTGVAHAAEEVARCALETMRKDEKRFKVFLSFLSSQDTYITYVPMHKKKERDRGFNQAELFAHEIAKNTGKKILGTLEKIKDTKPQVDLAKEERLHNIKDAFVLSRAFKLSTHESMILVDDIWTTGATLKECCSVLKKGGAKEVWGFTLARTP